MQKILFSIIIPVYKEEEIIINTLLNLKFSLNNYNYETIVVDGDEKKSTIKKIKDKKIIKIFSRKKRALQMNQGAEIAKGEILIFLHADTILPLNALDNIKQSLDKKKYKAGAFELGIDSKKFIFRIIENVSTLRTKIIRIPYGDQTFFIQKDYFFKIGKFKDIPIMEDVELMQRIKKLKDKIIIIHDKVKTSPRRWEREGIIKCTLRNWRLIILYNMGYDPEKLVKYYN